MDGIMNKDYLGDSVYVEVVNGMILLSTDNGCGESNEIFLEPNVVKAFQSYLERVQFLKG